MKNRPLFFKRKLFIDSSIQTPILIYSLSIATVGVVLASFFSTLWAQQVASGKMTELNWFSIWLGSLFCYAIMLIIGLYVSNRVAGPLHRLQEHMDSVLKGENPAPLVPRKDDFINKDLIAKYNQLIKEFVKTK